MSYLRDIGKAKTQRPWHVRVILACVALLALAACLVVSPYVLLVVGMSFDAPGANWNWMHIPVLGLPALLIACAAAAVWGGISYKLRMLWIAASLLALDVTALAIIWITVSG